MAIPVGTLLGGAQVSLPGAPVIGQVAPEGQLVHLGKLEGWWDGPPAVSSITQKANDHGVFLGPGYYGGRIINCEARIDGWSPGDSLRLARDLMDSLSVDYLTRLSVTDELGTLTAEVRQEGDPILVRSGNRMILSLSMIAPDPRRYGPQQEGLTGLPVSTGGFTLPITLPVSTGASTVSGAISAFNEGDLESNPVFVVRGPVPAGATITDQTGRQLRIADALQDGRMLYIDTARRTALLDGVANRPVTGTWPVLRPGANEYRFNASAYDAGAQLAVYYRSARR